MLKKYLFANLVAIPLHLMVMFMIIFGSMMGGAYVDDWFGIFNNVLIIVFYFSLIPNFVIFIKNFKEDNNIKCICISIILLYTFYFFIINIIGNFIFL